MNIIRYTGIDGSDNILYLPDSNTLNWKSAKKQVRINCKVDVKGTIEANTKLKSIENGSDAKTRPYSFLISDFSNLIDAVDALKRIDGFRLLLA